MVLLGNALWAELPKGDVVRFGTRIYPGGTTGNSL
jgi:hypothetical protein